MLVIQKTLLCLKLKVERKRIIIFVSRFSKDLVGNSKEYNIITTIIL